MTKKIVVLIAAFALLSTMGLFAQAKEAPKWSKDMPSTMILPSSEAMLPGVGKGLDAKGLAGVVGHKPAGAYGFSTGVSKKGGSFKLGTILADLDLALMTENKELSQKASAAVINGLTSLGAPTPLITAAINLDGAIRSGVAPKAVMDGTLPVFRPMVDAFVQDQGNLDYLRFGEWAEMSFVVLSVSENGAPELGSTWFNEMNLAGYYLSTLSGLPKGVKESLAAIDELGKHGSINASQMKQGVLYLSRIVDLMAA